jgi:enamine deaminase RidA (YjgF/YER057c/UK114 family)
MMRISPFACRFSLKQAVRNTEIVFAAAGAKLSNVAKFTLYVVDYDNEKFRIIREELRRREARVQAEPRTRGR